MLLSHALVEAFYLEGARGAVVTLANYSLEPIEALDVQVRTRKTVRRVESVRQGKLPLETVGDRAKTRLTLRDTDMLKLYW